MHSPAMIKASARIEDLHREAAANRHAKQARQARAESRGRIAGVVAGFRSLLQNAADTPVVPKLNDYPYRS